MVACHLERLAESRKRKGVRHELEAILPVARPRLNGSDPKFAPFSRLENPSLRR